MYLWNEPFFAPLFQSLGSESIPERCQLGKRCNARHACINKSIFPEAKIKLWTWSGTFTQRTNTRLKQTASPTIHQISKYCIRGLGTLIKLSGKNPSDGKWKLPALKREVRKVTSYLWFLKNKLTKVLLSFRTSDSSLCLPFTAKWLF